MNANKLIYCDFNAIDSSFDDTEYQYIDLCGYGTIASLNRNKIKLEENMKLTFFEPGELEVDATVHFYKSRTDINNPNGKWFAKFKANSIRKSNTSNDYDFSFLCFNCNNNLDLHLSQVGRQYKEFCTKCNTSIMFAVAQPKNG